MTTTLASMISIRKKNTTKKQTPIPNSQKITISTLIKIVKMIRRSSVSMIIKINKIIKMKEHHTTREITFPIKNIHKLEEKKLTFLMNTTSII